MKLIVAFRNFANAPKNASFSSRLRLLTKDAEIKIHKLTFTRV